MSCRRRLFVLVAALAAAPAAAQTHRTIPIPPPPIPDGEPLIQPVVQTLVPPPADGSGPRTWLEDGADPTKPNADGLPELKSPNRFAAEVPWWHPSPPPAAFAGSACNFNPWCGPNLFSPDYHSYQVLAGAYYSTSLGPPIPAFNYVPVTFRKGWMLTAPDERDSFIRGNWECLTECTVAKITSDYGKYLVGPSFFLRKNYLAFGETLVPYTQLGAGFVWTDAYKDQTQEAIGQKFEFILHAQVGLRYFVTDHMSIDIEGGLQHISNANLSDRNLGVNALGGQIGVTYHFPWGGQ